MSPLTGGGVEEAEHTSILPRFAPARARTGNVLTRAFFAIAGRRDCPGTKRNLEVAARREAARTSFETAACRALLSESGRNRAEVPTRGNFFASVAF